MNIVVGLIIIKHNYRSLQNINEWSRFCSQCRAWMLIVGFTLSYGSMFAKIWNVHRLSTLAKKESKVRNDMCAYWNYAIMLPWLQQSLSRKLVDLHRNIHVAIRQRNLFRDSNAFSFHSYNRIFIVFAVALELKWYRIIKHCFFL